MSAERLVFNGIDGASGEYLLTPLTPWRGRQDRRQWSRAAFAERRPPRPGR